MQEAAETGSVFWPWLSLVLILAVLVFWAVKLYKKQRKVNADNEPR